MVELIGNQRASSRFPEDRAGAAPMPVASRSERRLVLAGIAFLVLLALGLRLIPIIVVPSLNWGDEIFQALEPAHRLVYGYGLVPWEIQLGMRSWLLPGTIAGLMEIARIIGDGPQVYLSVTAVAFGLLACAPVICCFLWCYRWFGLTGAVVAGFAVAVAPELVYFGARTLTEVAAAHLLIIAFYLIEPGYRVTGRRRLVAAGLLLGIVCLLRLQIAPAVVVVALWSARRDWCLRLLSLIGGGLLALAFGAALDWLTLGYPLASVWRNLYDNLYLGISSGFSVEPWSYYLLGELGVWLTAAPFVVLLVALGARRMPALLAAAVTLVAVHSAIPHKEYRFIYPAVVLAMVLVAVALAQLTSWAQGWLRRRGMRQGIATASAMVVLFGAWGAVAFNVWSGGTLTELRQRWHDELMAMTFVRDLPTLCGIGLYGEEAWIRYGGYTYLDRPVPMYWPKDEAELTASAAAFDTLLYAGASPAPQLAFQPVRCFGRICLARRAGRCAARPTPTMWFPEQLRGMMPAGGQFEAVPQQARPAVAAQAHP